MGKRESSESHFVGMTRCSRADYFGETNFAKRGGFAFIRATSEGQVKRVVFQLVHQPK
ncbi:hypothetical protein [Actinoplanes sp. NPDC026619]|uniref:hypothetical protein n=1 Tax=Actinoplanes sp. NPDC026619 TaxID=3155798 RepID=UPI003409F819